MNGLECMLFRATTVVQKTEDGNIECCIEAKKLKHIKNVIKIIAQNPDMLDQCLCNHRWHLNGLQDCDLKCGTHPHMNGSSVKDKCKRERDVEVDLAKHKK
jgi:hypothetical protein